MTKCLFNYFLYYQLELRFYYPPRNIFSRLTGGPKDLYLRHKIL